MDWFVETFLELFFFLSSFWLVALFYDTINRVFQIIYPGISEEEYIIFFSERVFDGYWKSIEMANKMRQEEKGL